MILAAHHLRRPALLALLLSLACLAAPARSQATSTEAQKYFIASGTDYASFGRDVDVQGNVAIITANGAANSGLAYCYRKVGGAWTPSQVFKGSDTVQGDFFGFEAALDGTFAVIGASQADPVGFSSGAAYVFQDSGSAWTQVQKLVAPDAAASDNFGMTVAISGDLVVVGAPSKNVNGVSSGAAYVYRRSGTNWVFEQRLTASTEDSEDQFGWDVDTDGSTIFVSAIEDEQSGQGKPGAVFAFRKPGGTWQEVQRLVPGDAASGDWFGWDLEVDGDALAVGAPKHNDPLAGGGAVYVYRFDGSTWFEEDRLAPSKLSAGDSFGWSVGLQGDRLVAGAPSTGVSIGGALYLFHDDGTRWVEVHQWLTSDESLPIFPPAQLGMSCALDGKTAFGGSPFHDGSVANAGAAYRYAVTDLGLEVVPDAVLPNGSVQLETSGGLALAPMGIVLQDISGSPFNLLLLLSSFDANGRHTLNLVIPAGASGLDATFLSLGYWQGNFKALSNPATLTFL